MNGSWLISIILTNLSESFCFKYSPTCTSPISEEFTSTDCPSFAPAIVVHILQKFGFGILTFNPMSLNSPLSTVIKSTKLVLYTPNAVCRLLFPAEISSIIIEVSITFVLYVIISPLLIAEAIAIAICCKLP